MPGLMDVITQTIGGDTMKQMSRQLGTSEQSTGTAVSAALPMLLSALARNASQPNGAHALVQALDKDHDGSPPDAMGMVNQLLGQQGGGSALSEIGGMVDKLFGGR